MLPRHGPIIEALVKTGAPSLHLGRILEQDTRYWAHACRELQSHWWNQAAYSSDETPRSHYARAYAALRGIGQLRTKEDLAAVREFVAVWTTCPPLDEHEPLEKSQVSRECGLLLSPDAH